MRRISLFWRVMPIYVLIAALFVVPIWQRLTVTAAAQTAAKTAQSSLANHSQLAPQIAIGGTPNRIIVPSVGIDLPVDTGYYDFRSQTWSVTKSTANYAQNTAQPNNQSGMSLIYGHWTNNVFGPTKDLKSGDKAYVYTSGNHIFRYSFTHSQVVQPNDAAILDSFQTKTGLVLMTCQGTWAQERRLMYFDLEQAS